MTRAMPVPYQPGARRELASLDLGGLRIITGSKRLPCGPAEPAKALLLYSPREPHAEQADGDAGSGCTVYPSPLLPKRMWFHVLHGCKLTFQSFAHAPATIR